MTNKNLEDEVRAVRFRRDLFYRLSVVRLHLPSLRDRADDVPPLIQHFLDTGSLQPRGRAASRRFAASRAMQWSRFSAIRGPVTCASSST